MTLEEAREEIKKWGADLEVLRPFVDTGMEGPNQIITAAWNVAKMRFAAAVIAYAEIAAV